MGNVIKNSQISETAKLYDSIRLVDSAVGEHCTIGDDCDIVGGGTADRL